MKSYWKNINLKKITARLMAGVCLISSLCLGGNPFTVETFAEDCSVDCSNYPISGANNSTETIYTWFRIKDQTELDNLWTTYREIVKNYGISWDGGRIPLMITGGRNSGAENLMLTSPDDNNHGKKKASYTFNGDTYKYAASSEGAKRYDLANDYFEIRNMSTFDGWKCAQNGQSDVVVTRGLNGAFYLEQHKYDFDIRGWNVTLPYRLYNSNGTLFSYQNSYNGVAEINYGVGTYETPHGVMSHWIIGLNVDKGFYIYSNTMKEDVWDGYPWPKDDYYTLLYKRGIAINPEKNGWTIHRGVLWAFEQKDKGKYSGNWLSYQEGLWYNDTTTVEHFELWYGVPNFVSTYNLKSVDGGSKSNFSEETFKENPLTKVQEITEYSQTVAKGQSWGLNPSSVYYLKEGQAITIEEGATLIVGRNTVLFLAGNINNNGKIIVQPGGVILTLDPTMISGSGAITGSGDLIVRDGGKLRINELTISGDFYNSGYAEVLTTLKNGSRYISNGGALYAGITCSNSDYIVQNESELRSNIGLSSNRVQTARKTDVIQKYEVAKGVTAVNAYVFSEAAK